MDDVPLAGERAQLLAQCGDGVDGLGLFFGLFLVALFGVFSEGLVGNVLVLDVLTGLVLDVQGRFLGGLAGGGIGSLELVHDVRALDDVELVVNGLDRLAGIVQVRVRHGGCFFLDTWGWNARKGRR